jgi:hypothetical protein
MKCHISFYFIVAQLHTLDLIFTNPQHLRDLIPPINHNSQHRGTQLKYGHDEAIKSVELKTN